MHCSTANMLILTNKTHIIPLHFVQWDDSFSDIAQNLHAIFVHSAE